MQKLNINDHGFCLHCGSDLNGEFIWDKGFELHGTEEEADKYADAYGAIKGFGRFGREILMKGYDENYNDLPTYFKCPDCGEKCYEQDYR
jgi:hypothetical protein